jgi:hypothetical protein
VTNVKLHMFCRIPARWQNSIFHQVPGDSISAHESAILDKSVVEADSLLCGNRPEKAKGKRIGNRNRYFAKGQGGRTTGRVGGKYG